MDDEFRFEAPRDNLVRSVEFRAEPSDDGRTLEGYAAVFNDPTLVDSWEGKFTERMMPGSFTKTISEKTPVMMFNHGKHPMIGEIPIGTITELREDSNGLYVKGRLADNWLIEPVRDAIRDGAVTGMSMRMRVVRDKWSPGSDRIPDRAIHEVAVRELGPVVFPQYDNTAVSVRSREFFESLADPEVRSELALLFAGSTDLSRSAAGNNRAPHLHPRTHSQRRALMLALDLKDV